MQNENFDGIGKNLLPKKANAHCFAQSFDSDESLVFEQKYDIGTKQVFQIESCAT